MLMNTQKYRWLANYTNCISLIWLRFNEITYLMSFCKCLMDSLKFLSGIVPAIVWLLLTSGESNLVGLDFEASLT